MNAAYGQAVEELAGLIPAGQLATILGQDGCELGLVPGRPDDSFLGFVDEYRALARIIPAHFTILDLGCYLAAQSWFFAGHRRYIGVDVCDLDRFAAPNSEHHVASIQRFVAENSDLADDPAVFAVCNYVPDFAATRLVRETFPNTFIYYPAHDPDATPVWAA